jgi:predicted NBD/HSP70 family sugar kinase
MAVVLALDVGGTKLGAAVVDETGRMLGRGRVPSPTGTDPEQLY